jgi:bacillithiol synthase
MGPYMESHCIPFREIPQTTRLFSTFLEDFSRVASFYAHPPTSEGIAAAARDIHLDSRARRSLVEILRGQNQRLSAPNQFDPASSRNLDRLATGAVAIVTGQQVGLFSGPAYTFYKALSAVRCADEMTSRGIDAVPVFWLATEDHDLAEINHTFWNTRQGLARYELPAREQDAGGRVGQIPLGSEIQSVASAASQALEGPFVDQIVRVLEESYSPSETYGSAFGKLLARLLAGRGIIFIDPLDPPLHRLASPVYLRAIEQAESLRDALLARSKELESAAFHAQVKVTRETTLLFYDVDSRREPLRLRDGKFLAGNSEFSREQLVAAGEKTPELFSGSALLRPVIEDALLPTAAYIGGPAEVAYMAQAHVAYQAILGRMPAVLPRASFTLIEPPIARFMSQYDLNIRDILAGPQHLRAQMEQKSLPGDLAKRFDAGEESLRGLLASYEEPLQRLDPTLLEALHAMEGKILHQFGQLKGKIGRAENFRSGVLDRHQKILLDSLYTNGELQERSLCLLPFLATYGPNLLGDLLGLAAVADSAEGPSCAHQHHVLFL